MKSKVKWSTSDNTKGPLTKKEKVVRTRIVMLIKINEFVKN